MGMYCVERTSRRRKTLVDGEGGFLRLIRLPQEPRFCDMSLRIEEPVEVVVSGTSLATEGYLPILLTSFHGFLQMHLMPTTRIFSFILRHL